MCAAEKGCAEGSDHCCEKECSSYGGLRKCGRLSRKIFWADKVTLLIHIIHWYLDDLNLMYYFPEIGNFESASEQGSGWLSFKILRRKRSKRLLWTQ